MFYEFSGEIQLTELLKHINMDRLIKMHVMTWEHLRNDVFPACSEQAGREVFTVVAVMDLKGLTLSTFNSDMRQYLAKVAAVDQVQSLKSPPAHLHSLSTILHYSPAIACSDRDTHSLRAV